MDFSNRCRGCLSNDEESLRPLDEPSVVELFEECVRIQINMDPNFPRNICGSCYGKCTSWNKFKQQCWETNNLLNLKFMTKLSATNAINDVNTICSENQQQLSEPERTVEERLHVVPYDSTSDKSEEYNAEHLCLEQEGEAEEFLGHNDASQIIVDESIPEEEAVFDSEHDESVNIEEGSKHEVFNSNHTKINIKHTKHNTCNQCGHQFRSNDRYLAHLRQHQGLKPEVCQTCSKEFNSSRALRRHMQKHDTVKKYECKDCDKSYKYATSLTLHRKSHQTSAKFVCDLCGKSFIRAHGLKSHLLTHTTETPFECNQCPKQFKNEVMLRNHVFRRHESVKKFGCSDCGKAFITSAELNIHMRSHTNQKPYSCTQCDKCYKTQSHLAVHFRSVHTTNRPYACDFCSLTFAHSKVLKHHRLIHTGERPWSCTICRQTFRQKSTLQGHMKTHGRQSTLKNHSLPGSVQLPTMLTELE